MDVVFNLRSNTYYIDTAVVTPFSSIAGLISAASARDGFMAKREEKKKFDWYSPYQPGPLNPGTHRLTRLPRTKIHQKSQQLTRITQQLPFAMLEEPSRSPFTTVFQTTAPSRLHVTPGAWNSPTLTCLTNVAWLSVVALTLRHFSPVSATAG